jgi:hypothetical protein
VIDYRAGCLPCGHTESYTRRWRSTDALLIRHGDLVKRVREGYPHGIREDAILRALCKHPLQRVVRH